MAKGHSNRNARRSGGDKRFILYGRVLSNEDQKLIFFFERMKKLARETGMPYSDVLKRAREDGFFDATDEQIDDLVKEMK